MLQFHDVLTWWRTVAMAAAAAASSAAGSALLLRTKIIQVESRAACAGEGEETAGEGEWGA